MVVRFQMRKCIYDQSIQHCVTEETSVLDVSVPEAVEEAIKKGFLLESVEIVPEVSMCKSAFLSNCCRDKWHMEEK